MDIQNVSNYPVAVQSFRFNVPICTGIMFTPGLGSRLRETENLMRSTEISGVYMVFCRILKKNIYVCFFCLVFCASAYSKGKPWLATENGAGSLWGHTLMEAYGGVLSYYKGLGYTVKNNGCQKVSGTRFDCSFDHSKEGSHQAYDVVTMLHLYGDACPPKMILDDSTGICISQKNTGMLAVLLLS